MLNKSVREPSLGEFEMLVLTAVISAGNEAYGTSIQEGVERLVDASRVVSLGSVYTTLERLEEKGFLRSWRGDPSPERGGRAKRYYEVQASGMRALRAALRPLHRAWQVVQQGG